MRSRLVRFLSLASLMFSLQFLNLGCSSSSSEEAQGEEVAANEEGAEEQPGADEEDRKQRDRGCGARQHRHHRPPRQNRHLRAKQPLDETETAALAAADAARRAGIAVDEF